MAKKKGYKKKPTKDEKKKSSRKPLPKRGAKKKGRGKEKNKRANTGKPSNARRVIKGKVQKTKAPLKGFRKQDSGVKTKKRKSSIKGPNRDFRGRFIERHYQKRLKDLKQELIKNGASIDGKKVNRFTPYSIISKAVYENKLFSLAESHNVSYFDVLGKIITEVNSTKPGQEIFVKVKPFFKDFRIFNIKHESAKKEDEGKKKSYYSQAVSLNPQLALIVEHQAELIQKVIDQFPRHIVSPLFKIKEKRFENPLTGYTYALEYDYNDIIPSGMDLGEFLDFLKAVMGNEYRQIAILRMKANLDTFDEDE